jgi:hypothetical protein
VSRVIQKLMNSLNAVARISHWIAKINIFMVYN